MKIRIKKPEFGNQLVPADFESQENINKLKQDVTYTVNPVKCRNPKFLAKFFVLMKVGFENQKTNLPTLETYRSYILMKSGHALVWEENGITYAIAQSISFENIKDDFEFEKIYSDCFNQIIINTEADEELFKKELSRFMSN